MPARLGKLNFPLSSPSTWGFAQSCRQCPSQVVWFSVFLVTFAFAFGGCAPLTKTKTLNRDTKSTREAKWHSRFTHMYNSLVNFSISAVLDSRGSLSCSSYRQSNVYQIQSGQKPKDLGTDFAKSTNTMAPPHATKCSTPSLPLESATKRNVTTQLEHWQTLLPFRSCGLYQIIPVHGRWATRDWHYHKLLGHSLGWAFPLP